jgi:streptomycin 6-kinase
MLIERIRPGTMLSALLSEREEEATTVAAGIMRASTLAVPNNDHDFPNVADWAGRAMRSLRDTFNGGTGPFPRRIVEEAERAFDELIASTAEPKLLHGDLHHTNILASDECGWLAIDPKGVVGDIGYETATFIRNELPADVGSEQTRRLIARRVDQLAEALNLDRERVRRWALAHCVMSAWWDYDENGSWRPTIVIAEHLSALSGR